MPPPQKMEKFQQITEFKLERIIGRREGEFVCLAKAVEQFHCDARSEAVDRRKQKISKNWQWAIEGDVSARRSTPVPHGGE